jgi:hypothetical protein
MQGKTGVKTMTRGAIQEFNRGLGRSWEEHPSELFRLLQNALRNCNFNGVQMQFEIVLDSGQLQLMFGMRPNPP